MTLSMKCRGYLYQMQTEQIKCPGWKDNRKTRCKGEIEPIRSQEIGGTVNAVCEQAHLGLRLLGQSIVSTEYFII